jgi:hypothetical protein
LRERERESSFWLCFGAFCLVLDSLPISRVVEVLSLRCGSGGVCCIFLVFSLWWQVSLLVKVSEGRGRPWRIDDRVSGRIFSLLDF